MSSLMRGKSILLAFAALGLAASAGPAAAACKLGKLAELPVTMQGLAPIVSAKINGADVRLIADSGAFFSMLTPGAAARLGLRVGSTPFGLRVMGVTGEAQTGLTTVKEFTALGFPIKDVQFLVSGGSIGFEADGLLGRNMLAVRDVEFDLANGVIRLFRPEGCANADLAYWSDGRSDSVADLITSDRSTEIIAEASVNGSRVKALFDTGAPVSILTERAAGWSGVKPDGPGVRDGGLTGGVGRRSVRTWVAPFQSFKIGGEEIKNTQLRFGDIELETAEMLIGADFFLSHRVYISNSQHKIYFTYNGGPVFRLERASGGAAAPAQTPAGAAPATPASGGPTDRYTDAPKDAADYSRRGAAFAARQDFVDAVADFTHAAELEPKNPRHLHDRGLARLQNHQPVLAMSDLDQALALKPDDVPSLMLRGRLRLSAKDETGAHADFDAAARLDPTTRLVAADAYEAADLLDAAIAQLDPWIAANPKDDRLVAALNNRCWARALLGRELDMALADCNAALKLNPQTIGLLDSRGLVHLRLGQFDRAIADYTGALRQQPKNAWSLYGRGIAELRKGMKAESDADLKAAAALAPKLADFAAKHGVTP